VVLLEAGDCWMITECGDRDPSGARIGAILQTRLADCERPPTHIRAWLPPGFLPPQARILARETPALTMMLRRVGLASRLEPPLAAGDFAYWHADAF
jgi:hypothetical protein